MIDNLFKIMVIVNLYILTPLFIWGFYNAYPFFDDLGISQNVVGVFGYYVCLHNVRGIK